MEIRLFGTMVNGTMVSLKEEEQQYDKIEWLKAITREVSPMAFVDKFTLIILEGSTVLLEKWEKVLIAE